MKIISWNVQGAKKRLLKAEISLLIRSHKPYMLILLETMTNERNSKQIISKLGYESF